MEKQDDLTRLRVTTERGYKIMSLRSNEGWKVLRETIEQHIEAVKTAAVSPDSLDPSVHATYVGSHNALRSLLDILDGDVDRGQRAEARIKEIEKLKKEERKLGIHSKI